MVFLVVALLRTAEKHSNWLLSIAITVILGFLVSFGIESAQTIIPGRSPHMHDLFLNTTGALLGSIGFLMLAGVWALLKHPKTTSNLGSIEQHTESQPDLTQTTATHAKINPANSSEHKRSE